MQIRMIEALGFGVMEFYQFYKRVSEMTEASVGPAPWLSEDVKEETP